MNAASKMLTVRDVAGMRGVSADVVLAWIHSGELTAVNSAAGVGGRPRWRIDPDDLAKFVRRRTHMTPPPKVRRGGKPKVLEGCIQFFDR
jgi:excisionase family DNA binding protein